MGSTGTDRVFSGFTIAWMLGMMLLGAVLAALMPGVAKAFRQPINRTLIGMRLERWR